MEIQTQTVANKAALYWNLSPPILIRVGTAAVFRSDDCMIRVPLYPTPHETIDQDRYFARLANAAHISAMGPLFEPVQFQDLWVSAWEWIPTRRPTDLADIVQIAASLSQLTAPADFRVFNPVAIAQAHIDYAISNRLATPQEQDALTHAIIQAQTIWEDVKTSRCSPLHGDLATDNVIVGPAGPTLIDLEMSGAGPSEWDIVRFITGPTLFGDDPTYMDSLLQLYTDIGGNANPERAERLAPVLMLCGTSWTVARRHIGPAFAQEARNRLQCLNRPWRQSPRWHPL